MNEENFGAYIRRRREVMTLPLRKVAAYLNIDTSTLSKIERSERLASSGYLKPLSEILEIDYKVIQVRFIADRIERDFGNMKYLADGLKEVEKQIKKKKLI